MNKIKDCLGGLLIAFSFLTTLPIKVLDWNDHRLKWVLSFIPLVGLVEGIIAYYLFNGLIYLELSQDLIALIMVIFFILFTGGLHLDGLVDCSDALFSRQPLERKLEILKDPTIGTFGGLTIGLYLLTKFILFKEIALNPDLIPLIIIVPLLSRIFLCYFVKTTPLARDSGLARLINHVYLGAIIINSFIVLIIGNILYLINPLFLIILVVLLVWLLVFRYNCIKEFGGSSGDLNGAFIELNEIIILMMIVVVGGII